LQRGLEEVFGDGNSLVLTLPYRPTVDPDQSNFGDFTIFFSGDTDQLRRAFQTQPTYLLRRDAAPSPDSPNGFTTAHEANAHSQQPQAGNSSLQQQGQPTQSEWQQFGLSRVLPVAGDLRAATDDWPFLYLRRPMIPSLTLRGVAVMAALALSLLFLFRPRASAANGQGARLNAQMFLLGAGFMLIETKAVVLMALLFGSTWIVNSVVFFAVLVMILLANLWTIKLRPSRLWPYYAGLILTLLINCVVPLDFFLGMNRALQVVGSSLLVFAPVFFAGVVFAATFRRADAPDRAFGYNIAGAMLGGLAENSSMLLGFQYVVLVAVCFYALAALFALRSTDTRERAATGAVSEA
jgi:hypothetical protein